MQKLIYLFILSISFLSCKSEREIMQHIGQYRYHMISRMPRHDLLKRKQYLIEQLGESTWNTIDTLNKSFWKTSAQLDYPVQLSFTLRPPQQ